MTNEEKFHLSDSMIKYKTDPIYFVEQMLNTKLYPYQKILLKAMLKKDAVIDTLSFRKQQREWVSQMQLQYMIEYERDFEIISPEEIQVYKKGKLVHTIKRDRREH